MAAALPTADLTAVRLIALSLIQRQHAEGCVALVHYFDQFPPDIQAAIVHHARRWDGPLRQAAAYKTSRGPSNVVRIVVAAKAAQLAYLVTQQLRDRPTTLRAQAARGLLELARWAAQDGGSSGRASAVRYVQLAVEDAVGLYPLHKQSDVLLALAAFAGRIGPAAMKRFHDGDDPAVAAMRRMLVGADHREIRRAMLALIQVPTFLEAVLKGVSVARSDGRLGDVLSVWHLLLNQRVAGPLQALAQPQRLWPSRPELARWPSGATRGLARWAVTLGFSQHQRIENLSGLLVLPDAMSRLVVLGQLIHLSVKSGPGARANAVIARFCDDPEMKLAWIALRYLISFNWQGLPALLPRLINSPHREIAQLARQRLAPLGFERLWDRWPRMVFVQRRVLGRALMKIDPDFHRQLADKLASSSRTIRLRSISIIHELDQGGVFEDAMLTLAGHRDEKIASAAVRALGSARSNRAERSLETSLHHADSRVRANAIEAIQQQTSARHVRVITKMAGQEQHRPRANAIRALLQRHLPGATSCLAKMLQDPHPPQRVSALWVVETMGLVEVAPLIAEMSVTDPDRIVKDRADRVIHELIHLMDPGTSQGQTPFVQTSVSTSR